MRRAPGFLLPVAVLALGGLLAWLIVASAPQAERRPKERHPPLVEVITLQPRPWTLTVTSQGTVAPRIQTTLAAEVAGRIQHVAENFRAGGFFAAGDLLLRIDPRDYHNQVTIARGELAKARLALAEEAARARQAREDWQRLGQDGEPDPLTLRQPQLGSARAAVAAAEARLRQAELDLARTEVRAPFAGRVLEQQADVGQYVRPGTPLATVYATDAVEVRLPVPARALGRLNLPREGGPGPAVTLHARLGGRDWTWQGRIVRSAGALDSRTRELVLVARVDDPFAADPSGRPPLAPGTFVTARIAGRRLARAFVIPQAALRHGEEVLLARDGRLQRRRVTVLQATDDDRVVIAEGLAAGERLIVSPLPWVADGMPLRVRARQPDGGETTP